MGLKEHAMNVAAWFLLEMFFGMQLLTWNFNLTQSVKLKFGRNKIGKKPVSNL